MGSSPPPSDPDLPQSPGKSYSQVAAPGSKDFGDQFSNAVRYSHVDDLQGGVASVDLPEALLSNSKPLWSAYIVGHFMGDAPHISKVHAIVNKIWSFLDRPTKIDAQFIIREWSPKTASAHPDLTAVPLWVDLFGEPLPATISVSGSGEVILVNYPWLPPRCHGCQKWGHTDKNCSKNKKTKETEEESKKPASLAEGNETDALQAASAQQSSTKGSEEEQSAMENAVKDIISYKAAIVNIIESENNEASLTIPQSKSPTGRRNHGKSGKGMEGEPPITSSPSRFHLLRNELEEGEVESDSSDEESSAESHAALETRKKMEKQKLGKNKKSQKSNSNVNVGGKKDQNKGAKNKQANHASSLGH
uniref:DUF4283 domain-containing protein n=1 Tax=Brassica oleracea var. oleracea TaxID=109376 RepID=A0A0D3BM65_BRAOL